MRIHGNLSLYSRYAKADFIDGFWLDYLSASWKSSDSNHRAAQPRYHKNCTKKSIFKHYRVGRVHIKLFEKQGTKLSEKIVEPFYCNPFSNKSIFLRKKVWVDSVV